MMKETFNFRQKMAVVILDILILAELTGCLYWSNRFGEELTRIFLSTYLPMVLVTMIIGKICISRLRARA